jgi:hypothetical protein
MKTHIRSLLTLVCTVSASLLLIGSPAQGAGFILTLEQVGPNVVATGSGAIDLTGLNFYSTNNFDGAFIEAGHAGLVTGPPPGSQPYASWYYGYTGPTSFGGGGYTVPSSGSGDLVGIVGQLVVPDGYVSDTALSDTSTYNNATLSSLGVTPGTYEWTWGAGANQNFTLEIGAVPEPSTWAAGLLTAGTLLCSLWRRRVAGRN